MNYLIFGNDLYLIEQQLNKIVPNKDNIITYDLDINTIEQIIKEATTIPLFTKEKIIIIKNSKIWTSQKNTIEHDVSLLEEYLNNSNPSTTIIFTVKTEKLDKRKKITKTIYSKASVIECLKEKNINKYVKKMLVGYEIENNLINLIIKLAGDDLNILKQETKKLIDYKDNSKIITKEDIIKVISKNIQPDLYLFIDKLLKKEIKESLEIYYELLLYNEEPIKIIIMIANQFKLMFQTNKLINMGLNQNDIAQKLNVHPYRVKLALEKSYQYHEDDLLKYIEKLADLDYQIKSGKINNKIGLELFILSL